jgi:tRNA(Arg) A34 adenosine deaminase TadA
MTNLSQRDESFLRRAISLAHEAVQQGNRPFGSLIVDRLGNIIAEAVSTQRQDRDWTAHAEMKAVRAAGKVLSWDQLAECTIYASGDPCPMCAGAIYWSNIRRVVFGVDEVNMRPLRQGNAQGAGLLMTCREVLARSQHEIEVVGPALVSEALEPHKVFWRPSMPPEDWT